MKPISLTMQAFGAYLEPVTLDFSQLGERPIFLITGATGGGKTTILDAMCFALYCRATGGRRSWGSMRNTAAPDDRPTLVDFSFSLGDEQYRFCRSQSVHMVRGSGRREIRDEHICYRKVQEEWELACTGSETKVREYAQRLLGLTCEQFSQVIVLPQGDFLKLLRASSVNKAEILQTLFATKLWSDISKRCKTMADDLARQAGDLRAATSSILEREGVETREDLIKKQTATRRAVLEVQTRHRVVQSVLEKETDQLTAARELLHLFEEAQCLKQRQHTLQQQEKAMQEKQTQAVMGRKIQKVLPYFQAWKKLEQECNSKKETKEQAFQRAEEAQKKLSEAEKMAEKIPLCREQATQLAQKLSKLEEHYRSGVRLQELTQARKEKQRQMQEQARDKTTAEQQWQDAAARLKTGEDYVRKAQEAIQALPSLTKEVQNLTKQQEAFIAQKEKRQALDQAEKEFQKAIVERERCMVQLNVQKEKLLREETALQQDQAHSLAATLRENEPCPVCGSAHHPHPAGGTGGGFDAKQLGILRGLVKEAEEQRYQAEQLYGLARTRQEQCAADYQAQETVCRAISANEDTVLSQLKQAQKSFQNAQIMAEKLGRFQARIEELKREQTTAQARREEAGQTLSRLEQEEAVLQASREEILRSMGESINLPEIEAKRDQLKKDESTWSDRANQLEKQLAFSKTSLAVAQKDEANLRFAYLEAEEKRTQAKTRWEQEMQNSELSLETDLLPLQRSETELSQMEAELSAYQQELHTVQTQLRQHTEELEGKQRPDVEALEHKQAETSRQSQVLAQQLGSLLQRQETETQALEQLDALSQTGREAEEQFAQISRLSQLLMGKNPLKIPLHQFVLGIMLDDILSYANRFFSLLSHGRYSLRRILGSIGGNALGGLDLEVLDANLGGARSIETLSGGEQFLASLSLAFGLSDVVQSYSGSVHLDSIFIDEGFGSLDQETLDTAMKALSQIQKMGRTIGIISHVSELKNRIATRIEVGRDNNGHTTASIVAT